MNNIFTSKESSVWKTPQWLIERLEEVIPLTLDVCADDPWVCTDYISPDQDGLTTPWGTFGVAWCNPPWSEGGGAKPWVEKAVGEWLVNRQSTLFLIPARTDTVLWQDQLLYQPYWAIWLVKGRLTFGDKRQWVDYHLSKARVRPTKDRVDYLLSKLGGIHVSKQKQQGIRRWFEEAGLLSHYDDWCGDMTLVKAPAPFACALAFIGDMTYLDADAKELLDRIGRRIYT